ncbi:hypothetical protein Poly51_57540 [Rubripirellula tenax]|uniref:N-acetyltransferase domain-containing protein n=1 Tax=Rubripirellula tenax TaxID=2528015 RepID=A0A5C6EBT8_9BACT|nr:hypothetical protein [Rubripirellula tenax]TWU46358.1 hypothetical protein Poly51_57540 [Rubripirellula tenax]
MPIIRSFRNGDLPSLTNVWMAHWSAIGTPPQVNLPRLEQATVARTFFDPGGLLVAEQGGEVVGWSHFAASADDGAATIMAVCSLPNLGIDIARDLLTEMLIRIRAHGFTKIGAGIVRDDWFGYAGLEPLGHGIGVSVKDERFVATLREAGFVERFAVHRMEVGTMFYRPPVSREALQLRRSAKIESCRLLPPDRRRSSGLSHIDIERYQLIDRSSTVLAVVDFWFSDPEAEVLSPSTAILDLGDAHNRGELSSAESYLIAAALQSLESRNIRTVQTTVDSEKKTLSQQLGKICFESTDEGAVWGLDL